VTVNENAFELVTEEEYNKNSRVLSEYCMLHSRAWLNYFRYFIDCSELHIKTHKRII